MPRDVLADADLGASLEIVPDAAASKVPELVGPLEDLIARLR